MTNQSTTILFIILAIMSATLFFHQVEKLTLVGSHLTTNSKQIRNSIDKFEASAEKYRKAVEVKNGSDFVRGALDLLLSPFSTVINLFLDSVTDIENEAGQTIETASGVIYQYKNIVEQLDQAHREQVQHIISWRNIGLVFCLFSLGSALFSRPPKIDKIPEIVSVKECPVSIKNTFFLSIAGGIASCLPHFFGLLPQLILPSLLIAYFIDHRQLQKEQLTWKIRLLSILFTLGKEYWLNMQYQVFY